MTWMRHSENIKYTLVGHRILIEIKDYCITGRTHPIFCAVGIR